MSPHTVQGRIRRANWRARIGTPAKRFWTMPQHRRAIEMRARGASYGQIALAIGRTPDAVAAHLRAAQG